jgi:hypothetical protein
MRNVSIHRAPQPVPKGLQAWVMNTWLVAMMCGWFCCSMACATTVDFDALADSSPGFYERLDVQGYTFTNSASCNDALGVWPTNRHYQADPEFSAVFVNKAYSVTTATRTDGKPFDFHSIDLTDLLNEGLPLTMAFTFRFVDGHAEEEQVTLLPQAGLKPFEAEHSGLLSVSWRTLTGANGWNQFDNFSASASDGSE